MLELLFILLSLDLLPLCPCRSSSGSATADGETVRVCSAQSSDGQPAVEASWPSGCMSTGLGFVSEGPLSATTRTG